MPEAALGQLGLELGQILFIRSFTPLPLQPGADLGLDRAVAGHEQPQRFVLDELIGFAQRLHIHKHVARRVRLDRTFDVRPFERELTPTC